ncbi:winged helix-turn-helix domain-containing protein [Streptomyces sp. TRM70350]|uniref:winged helix-turn-helix domain-containing protein n=1 Tax=Streptomyces sp. TRM70350 TaxID=2856165 RepID=UPI0035A843CC
MWAGELFERKVKPSEVARQLRVSRKSAYQWHQLWRDGGAGALVSRGPSGSRCRLSPRCLEKLAAYLEQGPAAHGWVEDQVWTTARVATLIGRKFHVSYSVSGATRLMHRPGSRTRQCHRLRTHRAGKGRRRSMGERDFIALIDGVHQLVKAPVVLVWAA